MLEIHSNYQPSLRWDSSRCSARPKTRSFDLDQARWLQTVAERVREQHLAWHVVYAADHVQHGQAVLNEASSSLPPVSLQHLRPLLRYAEVGVVWYMTRFRGPFARPHFSDRGLLWVFGDHRPVGRHRERHTRPRGCVRSSDDFED